MKRFLMTALCLCLTATVHADNWFELGANEEALIYANTDSFRKEGNIVGMWIGYVYMQRQNYNFEMTYTKFNCKDLSFRPENTYQYKDHRQISEWHSQLAQWKRPAPSSDQESRVALVCAFNKTTNGTHDDKGDPLQFAIDQRKRNIKIWTILKEADKQKEGNYSK